jgi:hypothetical protein
LIDEIIINILFALDIQARCHTYQRRMWLLTILILVFLPQNQAEFEEFCNAGSMSDFVRDNLPGICFKSDSAGRLNYSMNNVEFYNAHCRVYQEIKQCLDTKLKHCEEMRAGFKQHVLNLVESYQLPLEYFDHDEKIYDDDHYLQNLIPFCNGDKLSGKRV